MINDFKMIIRNMYLTICFCIVSIPTSYIMLRLIKFHSILGSFWHNFFCKLHINLYFIINLLDIAKCTKYFKTTCKSSFVSSVFFIFA